MRASVRPSDATVPRFNPPAEPARTVGFGKPDSARTVWFGKRDSARTVGFGNQAASARAHGTWFSGLGISTLGPGKFQDMVFRTWDLNFGAWIFTLAVSKTETWKLLGRAFQDVGSQLWDLGNFRIWFSGHGFQDLGSQLWGLDFHTRGFQDRTLKTFRTWFSGCGISILGPGFHTGAFTVAFGHGHPLVDNESLKYEVELKKEVFWAWVLNWIWM